MPTPWGFTSSTTPAGRWLLAINGVDVTNFRGVPTLISDYSFTDPFGDSLANLSFPQITGYDDFDAPELTTWLARNNNVDIYWVPTTAGSTVINPVTGAKDLALGTPVPVWEGYVASFDLEETESGSMLMMQCQGALLQLDRYKAKPSYPAQPIPYEVLIRDQFDRTLRPNLRTQNLLQEWPSSWALTVPSGPVTIYTPKGNPGDKTTGYSGRDTGAWDASLTGFIASLLAVMYTQDESGVTPGNQWTIRKDPGRQPVLYVRDRYRAPDFSVWYGQVGVKCARLTQDGTQVVNVIYGEGTAFDGTGWRNAVISSDGLTTDYAPLAWSPDVYPPVDNPAYDPSKMVMEAYTRFPSGFDQVPATDSSKKVLARDADPGWVGEMVLSIDPSGGLSRFQVRAGMTVNLKGFAGTGSTGMNFHIAECTINPEEGTATLKIDTKYRDLLTLEEVVARTRDPLTPTKMLQVNKRTVLIEDITAPWDYTAGSGYMPTEARKMLANADRTKIFPWASVTSAFPPSSYPQYYIHVRGNYVNKNKRWAFFPVLAAQKCTIRRLEMVAVDLDGLPVKAAFHLSLYHTNVDVNAMPMVNGVHSPFWPGAFETLQPNGNPWPAGSYLAPANSIIIGWGNSDQPAGYSPGSKTGGNPITGQLVDEASWSFDTMDNPNFLLNARPGQTVALSAIAIHGALYTDYPDDVYFIGRFYRQEPGTQ